LPYVANFSESLKFEAWVNTETTYTATSQASFPWATAVTIIWALGVFTLLSFWSYQYVRVKASIRTRCKEADHSWKQIAHRIWEKPEALLPRILACDNQCLVAGVFGLRRPVIIIPATIPQDFTDFEREAFLRHEFQHIYKRDNVWIILQKFIRNLVWFHPMVWWFDHQISAEREIMRDAEVIRKTNNIPSYLNCLMKASNFNVQSNYANSVGIKGSAFSRRIKAINRFRPTHLVDRLSAASSIAAIIALTVFLSSNFSITNLEAAESDANSNQLSAEMVTSKELRNEIRKIEANLQTLKSKIENQTVNLEVKKITGKEIGSNEYNRLELLKTELAVAEQSLSNKRGQIERADMEKTIALKVELHQLEEQVEQNQFPDQTTKSEALNRIDVIKDALDLQHLKILPSIKSHEQKVLVKIKELNKTDIPASIDYLESEISDESSAALHFNLGVNYYKIDDIGKAEAAFMKALELHPTFRAAAKLLGYCYLQNEQWEKARGSFSLSQSLGESDPQTDGLLGMISLNLGQMVQSEIYYRRAIEGDPEQLDWWKGLINTVLAQHGEDEGMKLIAVVNNKFGEDTIPWEKGSYQGQPWLKKIWAESNR